MKNIKKQNGGWPFGRSKINATISPFSRRYDRFKKAFKGVTPVVGTPFKRTNVPTGTITAMRSIINSAQLLKNKTLTQITNPTGSTRTSYNVNAIKKFLSDQGYSSDVANILAKKVSNHGISKTAKYLGIRGYRRNNTTKRSPVLNITGTVAHTYV